MKEERKRLLEIMEYTSEDKVKEVLSQLIKKDDTVVSFVAKKLPWKKPDLKKCKACKVTFDANRNSKAFGCCSREHDFDGLGRGERPSWREWDSCCSSCTRGALAC